MKNSVLPVIAIFSFCFIACQQVAEKAEKTSKESQIIQRVLDFSGGAEAWDKAVGFQWNFFGSRMNYWNKQTGDFRTDFLKQDLSIVYNLSTQEGKAWLNQKPVVADSLAYYLDIANQVWCNDAYWVFMPFKLEDEGVSVKWLRSDSSQAEEGVEVALWCDVLELKFDSVGYTPENKYEVFVDKETGKVAQWTYFRNDSTEVFTDLWANYERVGDVKLATYHTPQRVVSELRYFSTFPDSVFSVIQFFPTE